MLELFYNATSVIGYVIEAAGVIIIAFGALWAIVRAVKQLARTGGQETFGRFRLEFARAMMLGLDFLIAGDIIRTVIVAHNVQDILTLGLLVLIRTVLVFTKYVEIEGLWPWQAPPKSRPEEGQQSDS